MPRSMHAWMTLSGVRGNPPVYHFWQVTGRPIRACQFVTAVSLRTGGRDMRSVAPNPPPRPPLPVSDSPAGRAPAVIAHVYGGLPPAAVSVWLYATPIWPPGIGDVVATDRPVAATSLNDTAQPVHPLVPAVWLDVPVTDTAPPAADSLYAEYTGVCPEAVIESSRVYPDGSVQVTAAEPVAVQAVTADAVPVPALSTVTVAPAMLEWNSARAARRPPEPPVNAAVVIPAGHDG